MADRLVLLQSMLTHYLLTSFRLFSLHLTYLNMWIRFEKGFMESFTKVETDASLLLGCYMTK